MAQLVIEKYCAWCGVPFYVFYAKRNKKTCCRKCYINSFQLRKTDRSGANHPNWKGGITGVKYSRLFARRLKGVVFKRDGGVCQLCNRPQTTRGHHVHHMDGTKTISSPGNLILLCLFCHRLKVHQTEDLMYKTLREKIYSKILHQWVVDVLAASHMDILRELKGRDSDLL